MSLLGALCYAELASAYPSTGGDYQYLARAFGRRSAFLFAWARLCVIQTGAIALLANTTRICVALEMQRRAIEVSWLTGNQLHRLEGIVIYFGFLLLLFMLIERMDTPLRLRRIFLFPLLVYYATTLGIPLVNGSFRQPAFWEHFGFVLILPLIVVLPCVLFVPFRGNYLSR